MHNWTNAFFIKLVVDNITTKKGSFAMRKMLFMLALLASSLFAHTKGVSTFTVAEGFMHPFGGLDHIFAMLAVGIFASFFLKKDAIKVIGLFAGMMVVGAYLATFNINIPSVEAAIIFSMIATTLMIVFVKNIEKKVAFGLIGVFGMIHGSTHGLEFSQNGSFEGYVFGFLLATLLMHFAGLFIGVTAQKSFYLQKNHK